MIPFIVLLLILTSPLSAVAGEKGKLVNLLVDYADFKQRVQDIRPARKGGYSSDSREMLDLRKEILEAIKDAGDYQAQLKPRGNGEKAYDIPLVLTYAYYAMFHIVTMEIDRNLYKSDLPLTLLEKYADIWQAVARLIPVVSAP